jgi:5-methylcytosine-specific restriction endonuclease McrA
MIIPRLKPITNKRLGQIQRARNMASYRDWRATILARDGHRCQYPGCGLSEKLEVHHIKKHAVYKHLRLEPFNGITLCEKHHSLVTGQEGRYELFFFKINMSKQKQLELRIESKNDNTI